MKNNQKGLAPVIILVVFVAIAVIGFTSYRVYDNSINRPDSQNIPTTKYIKDTDSTKTFSFEYPESWKIVPYVWEDCCNESPKSEPDWIVESKPITLQSIENEKVMISIAMNEYTIGSWASFNDLRASVKEDYFAKILFDGTRDDGHKALFSRVDYLGPPDAKVESFTDHRYYYDNDKTLLSINFREKYHHDWPDNEAAPDINNSQYLADFEHIAKSIKFSNNQNN